MHKLYLVFISIFAIGSLGRASVEDKSMSDYWKDVGLPFSIIEKRITNAHCYSDFVVFQGCVQSLSNVARSKKQPMLTLAPAERLKEAAFGKVIEDFGAVKLVERAKGKKLNTTMELVKEIRVEREAAQKAWKALYEDENRKVDFEALATWLKSHLLDKEEESEVTARAINAYLKTVTDPHTRIEPAQFFEDQMTASKHSFMGIGVQIRSVDDKIVVERPIEGGPALEAGVRVNDIIVKVDGKSIEGMSIEDAKKLIVGPKDTTVVVGVLRKGKPLEFKITRREIITENTVSQVIKGKKADLGYIKLNDFISKSACDNVKEAIEKSVKAGVKGLIFDMRQNGGGLLTQAVCIGNLFIEKGKTIVEMKDLSGGRPQKGMTSVAALTELPMVTLIDSSSASASEIVAGALQDHKRSLLVGERSYGKGSVQTPAAWGLAKGVLLVRTTARFYLPSGRTNQIHGVLPDIAVYTKPNPTEEDKFAQREEDMYTNALTAIGEPWKQTRPEVVEKVKKCIDASGEAKKQYDKAIADDLSPDYQRYFAEDALNCVLGNE